MLPVAAAAQSETVVCPVRNLRHFDKFLTPLSDLVPNLVGFVDWKQPE